MYILKFCCFSFLFICTKVTNTVTYTAIENGSLWMVSIRHLLLLYRQLSFVVSIESLSYLLISQLLLSLFLETDILFTRALLKKCVTKANGQCNMKQSKWKSLDPVQNPFYWFFIHMLALWFSKTNRPDFCLCSFVHKYMRTMNLHGHQISDNTPIFSDSIVIRAA